MFGVAEGTVFQNSDPVVIDADDDGASQRNGDDRGGRAEDRKQSQQVATEDKNPDASKHGHVLLAFVADVVFKKIADSHAHRIGQKGFQALLGGAGTVNGNSALQPQKEKRREKKNYNLEGYLIGDGIFRI